ncbi:MAG: phosphatidylserine/phosphatidylglycerophosphate/c ardiolipin synthase family protein [Chlamydiales bacterium]
MIKSYRRPLAILILAIGIFSGIFYIANSIATPQLPSRSHPSQLYATEKKDDLRLVFGTAMDKAKKSIFLVMYALSDHNMIQILNQKAHDGIDVTIVCDANASKHTIPKLVDSIKVYKEKPKGIMHQKLLVIDQKTVFIGSANMTTESLRLHGNMVLGLYHPNLAKIIMEKGKDLAKPVPAHHIDINKKQSLALWFLPDNSDAIDQLKALIQSAQKTIRVAMFTWTRRDLAEEIIAAHQRGVNVEVVIDKYAGRGSSRFIVSKLKEGGIPVKLSQGSSLLHHKLMYIDDETLIDGSANWTKAAFTQNYDCFFILKGLSKKQKEVLKTVWNEIANDTIEPDLTTALQQNQQRGAEAVQPTSVGATPFLWTPCSGFLKNGLFLFGSLQMSRITRDGNDTSPLDQLPRVA